MGQRAGVRRNRKRLGKKKSQRKEKDGSVRKT